MQKQRPPAVTVMAILNLVFGGLGLAGQLCLGLLFLVAVAVLNQPGVANDKGVRELKDVFGSMAEEIPLLVPFFVGSVVLGLVMAIVLVVAGIGLLKMRPWARLLSIGYAVFNILFQIASVAFQFAYLNPAAEKWQQDYLARHPGPLGAPGGAGGNPVASAVGGVFGTILGMGYAVALLVVMYLPPVVAAFQASGPAEASRRPDEDDYYDRGWGSSTEPPARQP